MQVGEARATPTTKPIGLVHRLVVGGEEGVLLKLPAQGGHHRVNVGLLEHLINQVGALTQKELIKLYETTWPLIMDSW